MYELHYDVSLSVVCAYFLYVSSELYVHFVTFTDDDVLARWRPKVEAEVIRQLPLVSLLEMKSMNKSFSSIYNS